MPHSVLKTNSNHFLTDNSPVFITERICVYRAVRTESLNIIQVNLTLYRVKWIFVLQERRIHVQFLKWSFTYINHAHRTIILTSLGNVWRNFPRRQLQNSFSVIEVECCTVDSQHAIHKSHINCL